MKTARATVLVVDDEPSMVEWLSVLLDQEGYEVITATEANRAIKLGEQASPDILLVDIKMPGKSGLEVFSTLKSRNRDLIGIVMTAFSSVDTAVKAIRQGARDYLIKPFDIDQLTLALNRALGEREMQKENLILRRQVRKSFDFREITGRSKSLMDLLDKVRRVATTDSTVLITGESGTGKELIAKAIHYNSHRADGPLLSVNCGGFSRNLLESELFGHVKGSFTGAHRDKEGLLVAASGGTFFMDEISELDRDLQVKLLRALQERIVLPVGGTETIPFDVRLVAATNVDLEKRVEDGSFRSDLYYRLNVIPLRVPPLRERRDDIPLLLRRFLRESSEALGMEEPSITEEAMEAITAYDWPGNVRELENLLERLCVMSRGEPISLDLLPDQFGRAGGAETAAAPAIEIPPAGEDAAGSGGSPATLKDVEKAYTYYVLEHRAGGQKKLAAELLGINESTLHRRLQRYEEEEEEPRRGESSTSGSSGEVGS
ncbi:sigma-54-dependent Fis family transcriptional regulator [Candidatus Fermentibacterales bacterium]|nr:sigma-54-dependent Fis family transcriptional regulator [Candidatus Fermentibacterales bacterium]